MPRLLTMLGIQLMFLARDNLGLAARPGRRGLGSDLRLDALMQAPETLLGTAIATALLPSLAEFAGKAQWQTFSETLEKALRVLLALTPAGRRGCHRRAASADCGSIRPGRSGNCSADCHVSYVYADADRLRPARDSGARFLCPQRTARAAVWHPAASLGVSSDWHRRRHAAALRLERW